MSSDQLDSIFAPRSIAVVGASDRAGSVGYITFSNLLSGFKQGRVYPINNKRDSVQGVKAYPSFMSLPEVPDLAIVCTPSETVKDVVEDCGKAGVKGMIIITAGFAELGSKGKELLSEIGEIRKRYGIRVIGPNCLGVIIPSLNMNASFAKSEVPDGNVAFVSQSGALGCALIDWAQTKRIGMSSFVSIGTMMDVDFGDLIAYYGKDGKTQAIFLYVESLKDIQKFLDNAAAYASSKPIFAVKSGREAEGAKAAASHTGALAGEDSLYEAAFRKAGIVRVDTSSEFLDLFKSASLQPLPQGDRILIITNAGGPGVMATDYLIRNGMRLAELSPDSVTRLNGFLPPFWSRSNPVDILGDAADDRYSLSFEVLLKEQGADAVLVLLTPQAMTRPVETANVLVAKAKGCGKTVLASFMGEGMVEEARNILLKGGIPVYNTPEEAIRALRYELMSVRNGVYLKEISPKFEEAMPDPAPIRSYLAQISGSGRKILTELESKALLEKYGIATTLPRLAHNPREAAQLAKEIGFPVVMKVQSEDISHKSDANAVMLNILDEAGASAKYDEIVGNSLAYKPGARIDGVTVQKMAGEKGFEVILGSKRDALFGPSVLFGMGGVAVEAIKDTSVELAPLDLKQAHRLIGSTKIGALLRKGFRNLPPADTDRLAQTIVRFSRLVSDIPEIKEIDINPLKADDAGSIVLDSRIILA